MIAITSPALLLAAIIAAGPAAADQPSARSPALQAAAPPAVGPPELPPPAGGKAAAGPPATSGFGFPILFWLPETRLGLGAAAGIHYRLEGAERASSVFLVGAYTLNAQGTLDLASDVYLRDGTLLSGRLRAVHFPDDFYGVGPASPASAREPYTRRWLQAIFSAQLAALEGRLRAGPRLDLRAEEMRDLAPGGLLASGAYVGADGFRAVGGGGSVTWDTRDVPLFPRRGAYVEAWALHYPEALGHHPEFSVVNLEGRLFLPLARDLVLGGAAYLEQDFGHPPFTLLPKLGSSRFLRGFPEGRWRDRSVWSAQTELRFPLLWRVSGTTFVSVGDVAPDLGDFHARTVKVAGGAGLRYRLTPEGANLRVDVAVGRDGPQAYVLLLDAF